MAFAAGDSVTSKNGMCQDGRLIEFVDGHFVVEYRPAYVDAATESPYPKRLAIRQTPNELEAFWQHTADFMAAFGITVKERDVSGR